MSKIKRQTLVDALARLQPGLSNKDIIQGSQAFNFHGSHIITFNDLISVSVPLETGIEGAVKADDLHKLLSRITADEVELIQTEAELQVRAGRIRAGLSLDTQKLPHPGIENEWLDLPPQFKEATSFCQFSTSKDMTRPHLTCIHYEGVNVSSSDRFRITQFIMTEPVPVDFLLPAPAANALLKYEVTHMALDPAWIHFADCESGLIFSARRILAELIKPDQYFEVEGDKVQLPDLAKTLERARVMTEADTDLDLTIRVELHPSKLICRGQKEIGWIQEEIDLVYQGEPRVMLINPIFLVDILSRTKDMIVSENMALFLGENFKHVMLLVKE